MGAEAGSISTITIARRKFSDVTTNSVRKTPTGSLDGATLLAAISFAAPGEAVDIRNVIKETVKSNPLVLAELRETDARNRQVRQALAGYYPTLDLVAGYGFQERDPANRTFANPSRTRNELERRELQLSARQLIFDGFYTPLENKNQQARERSAVSRDFRRRGYLLVGNPRIYRGP
ncbi:MAG: TolC family protein [Gammaproteobacteria bacterium]|nr:TolC family protein [Gammaproteobacteria bacterium]